MDALMTILLLIIALLVGWTIILTSRALAALEHITILLENMGAGKPHHVHSALTNYSVFRYSGGDWQLVETRFEPGFVSDHSPRRPGAYEGETIRRPAVRQH